jgi:hypothetical protein
MTAALKQVADQLTGINGAERVKGAERFEGAAGELTGAAGELEAERIKAKVRAQLTNRPAGRGPLRPVATRRKSLSKAIKIPLGSHSLPHFYILLYNCFQCPFPRPALNAAENQLVIIAI